MPQTLFTQDVAFSLLFGCMGVAFIVLVAIPIQLLVGGAEKNTIRDVFK